MKLGEYWSKVVSVKEFRKMNGKNAKVVGKHVILECAGKQAHLGIDKLKSLMSSSAIEAGATILSSNFHHFGEGQGVTGVLILAESHITVHTWPENNYAAFDFFMCGLCDPEVAAQRIIDYDKNAQYELTTLSRQKPHVVKQLAAS